ncbi:chitosanase [Staphylococcus delphini]|uniref:chitosanase n=1 Tax=Staphylococcus delphini TaxID=53344 RepID=UPI00374EB1E9
MKNTVKVILSGAVVASSIATYGNVAQAATQEDQDVTTQISQKAKNINPDNYMDSNYHLRKTIMALVGAAENTDTNYSHNYEYIDDNGDKRGYTTGVIGFTTGTDDMVHLVEHYNQLNPNNPLKPYESALKKLAQEGSDSHEGLDGFVDAWEEANQNDRDNFVKAQNYVLKQDYMDKAVSAAKEDGLSKLGQYVYFDAIVKHGPGEKGGYHEKDPVEWSFDELREKAIEESGDKSPKQGADEADFLYHFIDGRFTATQKENEQNDSDDTDVFDRLKVQQQFIKDQNFDLNLPLDFKMNRESFHLDEDAISHYNDQDVDFEHA